MKCFFISDIWAKIKRNYNFYCYQEVAKKYLTKYIKINQINMLLKTMLIDRGKVNKLWYTYIMVYSAAIKKTVKEFQ